MRERNVAKGTPVGVSASNEQPRQIRPDGAAVSDGNRSEKSYMPDEAFEELRNDLVTAGSKRDLGDIAGAYGYLARGVRMFLEQWMAEQERKDDWATAQEADQYAIDARLEQGAYR